jgi:hypothetical protein
MVGRKKQDKQDLNRQDEQDILPILPHHYSIGKRSLHSASPCLRVSAFKILKALIISWLRSFNAETRRHGDAEWRLFCEQETLKKLSIE